MKQKWYASAIAGFVFGAVIGYMTLAAFIFWSFGWF
jgi:hypothetical protein